MIIAMIAVVVMVATDAFLVMATQPTDSPYVVLGQPPNIAPAIDPTPSPRRVLSRPGSSRRSFSIIEESKRTFDLPVSDPDLKKMKLLDSPALGGQQLIKNYLELLLINLMRNETEQNSSDAVFISRERFDELISDRVIKYMRDHICEKLSVEDVCSILHYNRSYVFRQFKKTTGSSLMAYFTKMKIQKAKEMLRESDLSVAAISDSLSFDDPNYFSKTFKKVTGYTPSTYRKMRRGGK